MSINTRRGIYEDFDPAKLTEGEPASVLSGDPSTPSGKAFYVCFQAGDVRRLVSIEDLEQMIERGDFTGPKGDQGVGVSGVAIDDNSHLIVTLTDGSTVDAGYILNILEDISIAEKGRETAEDARVKAESGRVAAEEVRERDARTAISESETATSSAINAASACATATERAEAALENQEELAITLEAAKACETNAKTYSESAQKYSDDAYTAKDEIEKQFEQISTNKEAIETLQLLGIYLDEEGYICQKED